MTIFASTILRNVLLVVGHTTLRLLVLSESNFVPKMSDCSSTGCDLCHLSWNHCSMKLSCPLMKSDRRCYQVHSWSDESEWVPPFQQYQINCTDRTNLMCQKKMPVLRFGIIFNIFRVTRWYAHIANYSPIFFSRRPSLLACFPFSHHHHFASCYQFWYGLYPVTDAQGR